jgi:hypothetical protein
MKKVLGITLLIAAGAFVVFMTGCGGELPGEVRNLAAAASDEGASVTLSWSAPTDATGDETYTVYFDETLVEEEITATEYKHFEPGKAGEYKVTVVTGNDESDGVKIDTYPIDVADLNVWELNGEGSSGIGFNVAGDAVATYSMASDANKTNIDCYFSNWLGKSGGFGGDYDLYSPAENLEDDPGKPFTGEVSGWRTTGITDALGMTINEVDTLPATGYYTRTDGGTIEGETYGIYTEDGYYGLIQVVSISTDNGAVDIKATFQPIQGLRLF